MAPRDVLSVLDQVQGAAASPTPDVLSVLDAVQAGAHMSPSPATPPVTEDRRSVVARGYDALFTPPEVVTAGARRIADWVDAPSVDRSVLGAQVQGFLGGAIEGAASLLTPGDVALTALGARPVADALRGVRGVNRAAQAVRAVGQNTAQIQTAANIAGGVRGVERLADADSPQEAAAGAAQIAFGVAGLAGGRRTAGAPVPDVPTPEPLALPPAPFRVTPDGRVARPGADIPMEPAPDGSFVRSVRGEYARREPAGLLPPGRPVIAVDPQGTATVGAPTPAQPHTVVSREIDWPAASAAVAGQESSPAQVSIFRRDVEALAKRHDMAPEDVIDYMLRTGTTPATVPTIARETVIGQPRRSLVSDTSEPRTGPDPSGVQATRPAVLDREIDPLVPAREAIRVRQYASDPTATDAPLLSDGEMRELERIREELSVFTPQRGRLVRVEGGGESDTVFARGGPGARFADDVRVISEQNVSNAEIAAAVDDLLAGKVPSNRLHTAAIDAVQGRIEGRPGYSRPQLPLDDGVVPPLGGGGAAVDDFERFAAMLDELEDVPTYTGRLPGEEGSANPALLANIAGSVAGGATGAALGYASGDTTEDKLQRAAVYGLAGAGAPLVVAGIRRRDAVPGGAVAPVSGPRVVNGLRPVGGVRGLNPRASQAVNAGASMRNPLAGADAFLEKFAGSNPLLRDGIKERLEAHGGFVVQRRGSLDAERTGQLAEQVRVDLGRALPRGTALSAEGVVAYTRAVRATMDNVRALSAKVASGQATDEDVIKLAAAQADADVVLKSLMGARSEAGRALAAFRTFGALLETGNVNLYREAANGLRDEAAAFAAQVSAIGDPLQQYRFLQSQGKAGIADKVRSYYYANILSGVKTHERNFIGNAASTASRLLSTPFAAAIDATRATVQGRPREVFAGELQPAVVGLVAGMEKGIKALAFTLRHGVSPDALQRSVTAATEKGSLDLPRVEFGGGGTNPFNWPGRLLDGADAFFRSVNRDSELYASAWSKAKAEGLRGQRLLERAAQLRLDATMQRQAQDVAVATVFQQKPGPITGALQAAVRKVPGGYFVVPFLKTPANILKAGIQASPAGFATEAGRQGGRAGAQAQGLAAMGTVALAPLAWLAVTGRLSGSGPSDPAERAALMESGWRPNSMKVGDRWIEYSLMQPISIPAMAIANAYETWVREGADEETAAAKAGEAVLRAGRSLLDQSYLSGLYDVLQAIESPERSFSQWAGRTAHSLTPFAGFQRTVTQATDPVVRAPKTVREVVASNVPGLSSTVSPRLSRFGEVVQRPGGGRAAVDPFNVSPVVSDPLAAELARLGVSVALPSDRVKLPDGATLSQADSLQFRQQKGQQLRQRLSALVENPDYQRLPDALKRNALERVKDASNRAANAQERARVSRSQVLLRQLESGQ